MTGTQFEREFCKKLFECGYWALNIPKDIRGAQPFDVIAIRGRKVVAVDCKVCASLRFPLSRVEDNQWTAFQLLSERCPHADVGIVCCCGKHMFYIPYSYLMHCKNNGDASVALDSFRELLCRNVIFGEG